MSDWSADIKRVVECCEEFNVMISHPEIEQFTKSSVNVNIINHVTNVVQNSLFFEKLSQMSAAHPIRLDIRVCREVYKISLRFLNILCKIVRRTRFAAVNICIMRYNMDKVGHPVYLPRGKHNRQYKRGLFIGCETPLINIESLEFVIAYQTQISSDVIIYKCHATYKQVIKLINMFEKMQADAKGIINLMTFVDRYPVIVLLDGVQILYKQHQEPQITYKFPLIRTCIHGKNCTRLFCANLHNERCNQTCYMYCAPAHISHYHNTQQLLVMDSMRKVYQLEPKELDPEIEFIRKSRIAEIDPDDDEGERHESFVAKRLKSE